LRPVRAARGRLNVCSLLPPGSEPRTCRALSAERGEVPASLGSSPGVGGCPLLQRFSSMEARRGLWDRRSRSQGPRRAEVGEVRCTLSVSLLGHCLGEVVPERLFRLAGYQQGESPRNDVPRLGVKPIQLHSVLERVGRGALHLLSSQVFCLPGDMSPGSRSTRLGGVLLRPVMFFAYRETVVSTAGVG